ncbi:DUF4268 domain-containing protein [Bradyrhizobium sp. B124]|uniref:DUF4268 domain-containing protein n=1 Tax=Bradyrhizobium sp. B124 TaxID=3140245 RepID=UPI003182D03B
MDLELERTEASAGEFAADIVARDLSTNHLVVIENQFGNTDHRHLGQLITYSSVLGAGVVVWIAENIRTEHKAAIDFLNQNLKESLQLYALEASVMRIDDSKPAFVLNIVSQPTEPTIAARDSGQTISETRERYRIYFQTLIDELRTKYGFTNARAGQPQNWYFFASDNSRIYKYGTSFANGDRVRVEVYLDCGDKSKNELLFDCLRGQEEAIENDFGSKLTWERLDERRGCRIATYHDGNIDADSEQLAEIREWTIGCLLKLKAVFPQRIEQCLSQIPADSAQASAAIG